MLCKPSCRSWESHRLCLVISFWEAWPRCAAPPFACRQHVTLVPPASDLPELSLSSESLVPLHTARPSWCATAHGPSGDSGSGQLLELIPC